MITSGEATLRCAHTQCSRERRSTRATMLFVFGAAPASFYPFPARSPSARCCGGGERHRPASESALLAAVARRCVLDLALPTLVERGRGKCCNVVAAAGRRGGGGGGGGGESRGLAAADGALRRAHLVAASARRVARCTACSAFCAWSTASSAECECARCATKICNSSPWRDATASKAAASSRSEKARCAA